MKKLVSFIVALAISFGTLVVFGAETEEMENVLISVKERIPDTEIFEEFNSSVMENSGEKVYSFDWSTNKDEAYKSMSVTVTDDGIITNYRVYEDNTYSYITPSINKMSSDIALLKAQKLVDELNPGIAGEIRVIKTSESESLFENTYRFQLQRVIDSVPVYNNTGYVTVGENADEIIRYNINYTPNITFENKDDLISTDALWKSFYEKSGLELRYISEYNDSKKNVYLAYLPKMEYQQYIDAKTGEISDIWVRKYGYSANLKTESVADSLGGGTLNESVRLSEVELEKLNEVSGLKTVDEAKDAVKNNKILEFEDDLLLNSVNLYKGYNDEKYYYDMTFESNTDEEYRYASVTIDAKTLEIIRWNARTKAYMEYRKDYEENLKKLDKNDILLKAKTALEHIAPEYFLSDKIDYRVNDSEKISNRLSYTRYVNDIVFCDDYANIEINPLNGKVWSFSMNYSDIDFPSPDGILSEQEAVKKLSEQKEFELVYFPYASVDGILNADSAKLGYRIEDISSVKIGAFDGKIKEYTNGQQKLNYKDISNHYAKEQIETLARFGIGFEGEEFKPDEIITQNEYITLLMATFSHYTPIILKSTNAVSNEYIDAKRTGIIKADEQNPNDALTREYAAIYMIRVLGIEEYAKLDKIYKPVFEDVNENVGYISILGAMGVFNGDENGLFNPDKNLTRADAAIIIYNYLSR